MKVLIVFNHPYEGSYCNSILNSIIEGLKVGNHKVDLINLDKDNFNPVMTSEDLRGFINAQPVDPKVIDYKKRLEEAEHLIFIFPIWWELMPALMKGFIDKVIFPGVAYSYANKSNTRMKPLLKQLKGITMVTTMNTPSMLYKLVFRNPIQNSLLKGTFWKLGYKNRKWISFNMVKSVSNEKREKWLKNLKKRFSKLK